MSPAPELPTGHQDPFLPRALRQALPPGAQPRAQNLCLAVFPSPSPLHGMFHDDCRCIRVYFCNPSSSPLNSPIFPSHPPLPSSRGGLKEQDIKPGVLTCHCQNLFVKELFFLTVLNRYFSIKLLLSKRLINWSAVFKWSLWSSTDSKHTTSTAPLGRQAQKVQGSSLCKV